MKKLALIFTICIITCSCSKRNVISQDLPVKIACVGNSITYGAGMVNREQNAYPKQLQNMLGDGYDVKNFGVNGHTLLNQGDYPYTKSNQYKEALAFKPDVVFIKLGTNDSKIQNRAHLDADFENDYKTLIQSFKDVNANARIVLLLPVPSFLNDSTSIWNPVIKNKIIPLTQKVALETENEVIDLYQLFINEPALFPDTVHPSSLGATRIAKRVYENIVRKSGPDIDLNKLFSGKEKKEHNFHGFEQFNFKLNNIACKIVTPKRVAQGNPWVLRARFWGHEPQTDIALLERGFHIAYCDVATLFGGKEAVNRWNAFYNTMINAGFSKKVVLEGMSRGGLIIYNWANENPEKVACIYADAPVLDGFSWPGGKGKGKGSSPDWRKFKKIYQLENEQSLDNFKGNPIHNIKTIANAEFPMLHVCGEVDKVVPVDENTRIFEKGVKAEGGNIKVIYKKDVDHHPHSLKNPTPIVNFILRAVNHQVNFATVITPGSEYRSGAGWKQGKDWWAQARDIDSLCKTSGEIDILLIGNSITQGWGGSRTLTTYKPGQTAADNYFNNLKWISAGISGDRTEHIAWRLKNGQYEKCNPKMISLAIGVNNFPYNSPEEIVKGIMLDLSILKDKFPKSEILLFGPLPTGLNKNSDRRIKYNKVHQKLISHLDDDKQIHYYNALPIFSNEDGNLNETYYSSDGIHLKPKGYEVWGKFIREQYNTLFKI